MTLERENTAIVDCDMAHDHYETSSWGSSEDGEENSSSGKAWKLDYGTVRTNDSSSNGDQNDSSDESSEDSDGTLLWG